MQYTIRFLVCLLGVSLLSACGSSDPFDFTGTWDGSFSEFQNNCPFSAAQSPGNLFPMLVSKDSAGVFSVTASNGDVATGKQGRGEVVSFTAKAPTFGSFGSTGEYSCTVAPYVLGYLEQGDGTARVTLHVTFTACTSPANVTKNVSCSVLYGTQTSASGLGR